MRGLTGREGPRSVLAEALRDPLLRRVMIAAAVVHVSVALALSGMATAGWLPELVLPGGVGIFASDGVMYLEELAELRDRGWTAILGGETTPHVMLFALSYVPLEPLFGRTILSVEPVNLLLFEAVLVLAWLLCRQFLSPRAAFLPVLALVLWPSFVLHSTQLLKTSFVVPGFLGVALSLSLLLGRPYKARSALSLAGGGLLLAVAVEWLRPEVLPLIVALLGVALVMGLVVRAFSDRIRWWSVLAIMLMATVALEVWGLGFFPRGTQQPSDHRLEPTRTNGEVGAAGRAPDLQSDANNDGGALRSRTDAEKLPSRASGKGDAELPNEEGSPGPGATLLRNVHDRAVFQRKKFLSEGGSSIFDEHFLPETPMQMIRYLPRAAAIGALAPFPDRWFGAGGAKVGRAGRLLVATEMPLIYALELMALFGFLACLRRRPSAWFLAIAAIVAMTGLGLVVANLGTLYRLRYAYLVMLLPLAGAGLVRIREALNGSGETLGAERPESG